MLWLCCACSSLDLSHKQACNSDRDCLKGYSCSASLVCVADAGDGGAWSDASAHADNHDEDALANPPWLINSMTFSDGEQTFQRHAQGCYQCEATLGDAYQPAYLRFVQDNGNYVLIAYLQPDLQIGVETLGTQGEGTVFTLKVEDMTLPSTFVTSYGGYAQEGTVEFSQAEIRRGGVVAATAQVKLWNGDSANIQVDMQLNFCARFPE